MKLWKVDADEPRSKPSTQPLYSVLPLKVSLSSCLPSTSSQGQRIHPAWRMQLVCTRGACGERASERGQSKTLWVTAGTPWQRGGTGSSPSKMADPCA